MASVSQVVTTRAGESVEVLDRGDLNKFLIAAVSFLMFVGGGYVWSVATRDNETRNAILALDTRVTRNEGILLEMREMSRQMDSLRITLRESMLVIRQVRP